MKNNKQFLYVLIIGVVIVGIVTAIFLRSSQNHALIMAEHIPLYPGTSFVSKEILQACSHYQKDSIEYRMAISSYVCDATAYTYQVNENDFEKVVKWYQNDESKSGWKLSGGAGTGGVDRFGTLSNGGKTNYLVLKKNETLVEITIRVRP